MSSIATIPPQQDASAPFSARNPWIYKPWIDLTVGCGAWSAHFCWPCHVVSRAPTPGTSRFTCWRCCSTIRTSWRRYTAPITRTAEFEKYSIFTLHITLLLALAGVLAHAVPAAPMGVHALYLLEPMALQRAKFRTADDVRAALRFGAEFGGAERGFIIVHRVLSSVDAEFSTLAARRRPADSFTRHAREIHVARASRVSAVFCRGLPDWR